ncbi:hypothetical protein HGRIS_000927 [Hohenbuehelia grisea]|uniref:Uncharacterized protein n=1 Tax=Hohenbuehelia grisea TaxID=104357 RepID=A0ABR3IQ52_9AGAR
MPADGFWPYVLQVLQAFWVFCSRPCTRRAMKSNEPTILPTAMQVAGSSHYAGTGRNMAQGGGSYREAKHMPVHRGWGQESIHPSPAFEVMCRSESMQNAPPFRLERARARASHGSTGSTGATEIADHEASSSSISAPLNLAARTGSQPAHVVLDMQQINPVSPNLPTADPPDSKLPFDVEDPSSSAPDKVPASAISLATVSSCASFYSTDDSFAARNEDAAQTMDETPEASFQHTSSGSESSLKSDSFSSGFERVEKVLKECNTPYAFNPLSAVSGLLCDGPSPASSQTPCVPLPSSDTPIRKRISGSRFMSPPHKIRTSLTPYPEIFDLSIYDRPASMFRDSMTVKSQSEPDVTVGAFTVLKDDSIVLMTTHVSSSSASSFHLKKETTLERDIYRGAGYSRVVAADAPALKISATCSGAELKKLTRRNTLRVVHDMTDVKEDCMAAMLDELHEAQRVLCETN